jgi:hypothetical protein
MQFRDGVDPMAFQHGVDTQRVGEKELPLGHSGLHRFAQALRVGPEPVEAFIASAGVIFTLSTRKALPISPKGSTAVRAGGFLRYC